MIAGLGFTARVLTDSRIPYSRCGRIQPLVLRYRDELLRPSRVVPERTQQPNPSTPV